MIERRTLVLSFAVLLVGCGPAERTAKKVTKRSLNKPPKGRGDDLVDEAARRALDGIDAASEYCEIAKRSADGKCQVPAPGRRK